MEDGYPNHRIAKTFNILQTSKASSSDWLATCLKVGTLFVLGYAK